MSPKVAFITGGNGITGSAILEHLVKKTDSTEWSKIIVTSRSPFQAAVEDDRITFVPLDYTQEVQTLIDAMLPACSGVTHAFFSSYIHRDGFEALNVAKRPLQELP
jgi:nucleoside-diphosphate-sugar epimerase